jgi:branched-chain amino acid transport system permease protein
VAYRPLRQAPRVSAIITALGVGLCLENVMLALYPYPQNVPRLITDARFGVGSLTLSTVQLLVIGISVLLVVVLDRIVHGSRVGMAMRAIAWDRATVPLMGVPVDRIIAFTFALGAALAGAAGVLYSLAYPVIDPGMGIMVGWKAFIATVVGGIGNVRGAMLGAYLLGAIEILVVALLPSTYRDLVVFSLLLAFVVIRPHGLLGQPRLQKV